MFGRATLAVASLALYKAQEAADQAAFDASLEDISDYVRETEEFTSGECSLADCEAGSANSVCNRWEYNIGAGWVQLTGCERAAAYAEAKEFIEKVHAEAAQDDIGQLLIQLEAVLKQREMMQNARSAANCGSAALCTADNNDGDVLGQESSSQCTCLCKGNGEQECAVNPYYQASTSPELTDLNRFKNLKAMVMTLQPVQVTVFGRYCYYGCWCLPNGQHNLAAGYGQPVDPIDEVCKEFALCYKCLDMDFAGNCNPEARAYRWGQRRDQNGVTYDLACKDQVDKGPNHRCKRYTCECDRVLAIGLGNTWMLWNESYHARWGGFDREANCETDCVGCLPQDDCCGAYGEASTGYQNTVTRRPYASTSTTSGCCGDVYYYSTVNDECCMDGNGDLSIVAKNSCLSPDTVVDPDTINEFNENYPGYTRK